MKISTGLRPIVKSIHMPRAMDAISLSHPYVTIPVTQEILASESLWVVELVTPADTPQRQAGQVVHVMVFAAQPTVDHRGIQFLRALEHPVDGDAAEAHYRSRDDVPDDAVRKEEELVSINAVSVTLEWYDIHV